MVQMKNRKESRVGPAPLEKWAQIQAVQFLGQKLGSRSPVPLVKISQYDFGAVNSWVFQDPNQLRRLLAPFAPRGSQVNIINMNRAFSNQKIYSLA
jgi:hypothetical protein